MRVACVNQDPGIAPGRRKGAAVHLAAMREAFRGLGCEVLVIDSSDEAAVAGFLEQHRARGGIDLVYERYALGAAAAARFARGSGVPLVLEVNAPLLEEALTHRPETVGDRGRALRREGLVFRSAERVLAVSVQVAEYVASRGVPRGRIDVRPNGVDTARFFPRRSQATRAALGVPSGAFLLGFHGRLRPWHGFERIAAALRRLRERGVDAHLLAVGEGDFAAPLRAAGVHGHATLLGWVEHRAVAELVACFDALPLGYPPDAPCYFSPLKLLEAMACGAVPVVPDLGDLPGAVGGAGLVYRAGSARALAGAIERLAREPALCRELSARSVAAAAQRSWAAVARDVLESAAAAPGGAGVEEAP